MQVPSNQGLLGGYRACADNNHMIMSIVSILSCLAVTLAGPSFCSELSPVFYARVNSDSLL